MTYQHFNRKTGELEILGDGPEPSEDPDIVLTLDWNTSRVEVLNPYAEGDRVARVHVPVGALERLVLEFWVPGRGLVRHRLVPMESPEQRGPVFTD